MQYLTGSQKPDGRGEQGLQPQSNASGRGKRKPQTRERRAEANMAVATTARSSREDRPPNPYYKSSASQQRTGPTVASSETGPIAAWSPTSVEESPVEVVELANGVFGPKLRSPSTTSDSNFSSDDAGYVFRMLSDNPD